MKADEKQAAKEAKLYYTKEEADRIEKDEDGSMDEDEDSDAMEVIEETKSSTKQKSDSKKVKEKQASLREIITQVSEKFSLTWAQVLEKIPE